MTDMPNMPATQTAPAAPAAPATSVTGTDTNSPDAAMASLFGDPVVAKGTGVEIKQSRLDEVVAQVKAAAAQQGQPVSEDDITRVEAKALDSFIYSALLLQKTTAADRAQAQTDVDKVIADAIKQYGSEQEVELRLKSQGMTMADFRTKMADSMAANSALVRELEVTVTDAQIKSFYDDNPTNFEQPEQVHVRHILFATIDLTTQQPLSDDAKQAKLKQAQDVLKQLRAGGDFAALARQYSDDPGTKAKGGELDPFSHGQMVAEFDTAAFSLTNNQISDIVTSPYGYHIIQLLDRTPAQKVAFDKVSDSIKNYLLNQKLAPLAPAYLQKLKKDANVQILDDNLKTAVAAWDAAQANPPPAAVPAQ
jgi:parvulin-like peptidyl-prolyl isomerase